MGNFATVRENPPQHKVANYLRSDWIYAKEGWNSLLVSIGGLKPQVVGSTPDFATGQLDCFIFLWYTCFIYFVET